MAKLTLGSRAPRAPIGRQRSHQRASHAVNQRQDRWSELTQQFAEALGKLPKTTSRQGVAS